jgi:cytochrome c oxidase subunit 1
MLGIQGMPRRIADYAGDAGWNDWNLAATIAGFMIGASMLPFLWNVFVSLRNGAIAGDDPWEANTLEWPPRAPRHWHLPDSGRQALRPATAHGRQRRTMWRDSHALATTEGTFATGRHDSRGGISNVVLDAPVHTSW